jgi:PAS domain S-box-containing protein
MSDSTGPSQGAIVNSSDALANEEFLSDSLFRKRRHDHCAETDRTFAILMIVQWIAGIIMAVVVSPRTWIGDTSTVHIHVWAAILLGGLVSSLPIALAILCPGRAVTRHWIAIAQMLWSALLIHLSGGRIETHFHVFGSLAFLAFYRDWKVLVTATLVVSVDHIVRGVAYPQSVFGVLAAGSFRWVEHAGWVVFEDIILVVSCVRGIRETREISRRRAQLELTNERIESTVESRTADLQSLNRQLAGEIADRHKSEAREAQLGRIIEDSLNEIYVFDALTLKFRDVNRGARENVGYSLDDLKTMTPLDLKPEFDRTSFRQNIQPLIDGTLSVLKFETQHRRKDGSLYPIAVNLQLSRRDTDTQFVAMIRDITERKQTEAELYSLQQEHMESSRQAGMAEIATGVLHNVGNVLNSVNVSANLLTDRLITGRIDNLQKAVAMLEEHSDDPGDFLTSDEKGRRLPAYLRRLSDSLSDDRDFMQTEVGALSMKIDHIKEIVQVQQTHSRRGFVERIVLLELVETALTVNDSSFRRHNIEIQREFDDVPVIETDKHQVLQILVNLISNARNAMIEHEGDVRRLTIRIKRSEDSQASIEVQDTGAGIAPDNLDRIFGHGFTTRKDGHGFGLHSSANAANELGGSLTVFSDGPDRGATFTLQLPIGKENSCLV